MWEMQLWDKQRICLQSFPRLGIHHNSSMLIFISLSFAKLLLLQWRPYKVPDDMSRKVFTNIIYMPRDCTEMSVYQHTLKHLVFTHIRYTIVYNPKHVAIQCSDKKPFWH